MPNRICLYEACDSVMRYPDFCSSNIEYTLHKDFAKKILFAMLDNFKTGNIVQQNDIFIIIRCINRQRKLSPLLVTKW